MFDNYSPQNLSACCCSKNTKLGVDSCLNDIHRALTTMRYISKLLAELLQIFTQFFVIDAFK